MSKSDQNDKSAQQRAGGRPSDYRDEYAEQAHNLCLLIPGARDIDLADFFGKDESTIAKWKDDYPEFSKAINDGKSPADSRVVAKLYKRCMGMWVEEEKVVKLKEAEYDPKTGKKVKEVETAEKITVKRFIPPSDQAIQYFLSNRTRTRDHPWYRHASADRSGKSSAPHANDPTEHGKLDVPNQPDHLAFMANRYEIAPPQVEQANGTTHHAAGPNGAANGSTNGTGGNHGEDDNHG